MNVAATFAFIPQMVRTVCGILQMGRPIYGILQMGRPIYGILQMGRPIYGIPVPVPIKTLAELQYTSWWDGSGMKFEMRGMDPTCCHPKLDSKYGNTEIQL